MFSGTMLLFIIRVPRSKNVGATILNGENFNTLVRTKVPKTRAYSKHFDIETLFFIKHIQKLFFQGMFFKNI